ncbi:MAG: fibronectin type III domain-containing protein [Actinomycetota bacterium]
MLVLGPLGLVGVLLGVPAIAIGTSDAVEVHLVEVSENGQLATLHFDPSPDVTSPVAYEVWYHDGATWDWVRPSDVPAGLATQKNVPGTSVSPSAQADADYETTLQFPGSVAGARWIGIRARPTWGQECLHPSNATPTDCSDIEPTRTELIAPIGPVTATPVSGGVELAWSAPAYGPTPAYTVNYNSASGSGSVDVPAGATQITVGGLSVEPHTFTVTANHGSEPLVTTSSSVAASPAAFGTPVIESVSVFGGQRVEVSFSDAGTVGERSYRLVAGGSVVTMPAAASAPAGPVEVVFANPLGWADGVQSVSVCGADGGCVNAASVDFAPWQPYGVTAGEVTSDSVELDWNHVSLAGAPLNGFEIAYREPGTSAWTDSGLGTVVGTSATVVGLAGDTAYEFGVRAVQATNPTVTTDYGIATATTEAAFIPGTPVIESVSVFGGERIQVLVTDAGTIGDRSYRVAVGTDVVSTTVSSSALAEPVEVVFATPLGWADGVQAVSVSVCDTDGVCVNPASADFAPWQPYGVAATTVTAASAGLTWSYVSLAGAPLSGFEIAYREPGTSAWTDSGLGVVSGTSATIDGLTADTSYEFGVRAVQGASPAVITDYGTATATTDAAGDPNAWDPRRARDQAGARPSFGGQDPAGANVYVVDPANGAAGVAAAISSAPAGSTILVPDGVYRGAIGDVYKTVEIRAQQGASPLFLGTTEVGLGDLGGSGAIRSVGIFAGSAPSPLYTVGTHLESGADFLNENTLHYEALIDSAGSSEARAALLPEQVFRVDTNGVWHQLTQVRWHDTAQRNTPTDAGTFTYNPYDKKIYVHLSTAAWAATDHLEVTDTEEAIRFGYSADGSALTGLEFRGYSPPVQYIGNQQSPVTSASEGFAVVALAGNSADRVENVTISEVTVTHSAFNAIQLQYVADITFNHVTVADNVGKAINSNQALNLTVEFSRFDDNVHPLLTDARSILAGVKVSGDTANSPAGASATDESVFRYNRFVDNHATGLWCDLWCENVAVVGNYIDGNTKYGVYYEVSEDAVIASNLFVDNTLAGIQVSGSQRVDIVRNTFAGNGTQLRIPSDIDSRAGDGQRRPGEPNGNIEDTADVNIEGNLFVEPSGTETPIIDPVTWRSGGGDHHLPSARIDVYDRNASATTFLEIAGRERYQWDGDVNYHTVEAFVAAANKGANDEVWRDVDPYSAFVDTAAGDYRLSPSIGALAGISQAVPADAATHMIGSTDGPAGAAFPWAP